MPLLLLGGEDSDPADPVIVPPSDDDLLDLVTGTRSAGFRFDLLDAADERVGELDVDVTPGAPNISNNINRTIKRTMDALVLPPSSAADVNPLVHRVRPMMLLSNGSEHPLGVFLFADYTADEWSFGDIAHGTMTDKGLILDQPISKSSGYGAGVAIADALAAEFTAAGLTLFDIDPTITTVLGAPVAWPAGTSRAEVVNELCAKAGAYSAWFSNAGIVTVRRVTDLATDTPELVYTPGPSSRIIQGSTTRTSALLDAPNRYIAIDGSATDSAIVGVFDVPASAPHSAAHRGFVVATVIRGDGYQNVAAATAAARAAYNQGGGDFEHLAFSGPPDPRHDTFQTVQFDGVNYREQEWSLSLSEGAEMIHRLRTSYTDTVMT